MMISDKQVEAACAKHDGIPVQLWRNLSEAYRRDKELIMRAVLEAAEAAAWLPISEAPKDGTRVLLANGFGCWMGQYVPTYTSGYSPENPWQSMMLNHWHMERHASVTPTHFRPLPTPPKETP